MRLVAILYGVLAYAAFTVSLLYAIGFLADLVVPKTVDSGRAGALVPSLLIDGVLLGLFAVQHSVMARPAFKAAWTKLVPTVIERSTYVLISSLLLSLICWQWRPLPSLVWDAGHGPLSWAIWALFAAGWIITMISTYLIDHFDLFGLRQVWEWRRAGVKPPPEFRTPLFYKLVRHPLYLGFVIAFWAAPQMSQGRLFFAVLTTAYIFIAIQMEERDLVAFFGETYRDYRKRVPSLFPLPKLR